MANHQFFYQNMTIRWGVCTAQPGVSDPFVDDLALETGTFKRTFWDHTRKHEC